MQACAIPHSFALDGQSPIERLYRVGTPVEAMTGTVSILSRKNPLKQLFHIFRLDTRTIVLNLQMRHQPTLYHLLSGVDDRLTAAFHETGQLHTGQLHKQKRQKPEAWWNRSHNKGNWIHPSSTL